MKHLPRTLTLLTLAALLLTACTATADAKTTLGTNETTAATTIDRDTLTDPNLTEDEIAFRQAVWAAVKDTVDESCTINDLWVGFHRRVDDVFMGYYYGIKDSGAVVTEGPAVTTVPVGEYDFIFGSTLIPSIFTDGKRYSLESAYSSGAITEDQLRRLWEQHKEGNIYYDEK